MNDPKFIATVLPNGLYQKNGETYMRFSLCTSINHLNKDLDEDTPGYEQARIKFYEEFCSLSDRLTGASIIALTDIATPGNNKFQLSNDAFFRDNCGCDANDLARLKDIRCYLWQNFFCKTSGTTTRAGSLSFFAALHPKRDAPLNMTDSLSGLSTKNKRKSLMKVMKQKLDSSAISVSAFDSNKNIVEAFLNISGRAPGPLYTESEIPKLLKNIASTATLHIERNKKEYINYVNKINSKGEIKNHFAAVTNKSLCGLSDTLRNVYIDSFIDLPEIFNTCSQLSNHPVIMRILGLIQDFEIKMKPSDLKLESFGIWIRFALSTLFEPGDWQFRITTLVRVSQNGKYAYLPQPKAGSVNYKHSVLDDKSAYMTNFDPVNQEQKTLAVQEKVNTSNEKVDSEFYDSFTRGIIYNHPNINELVQPEKTEENDKVRIYEGQLTMGQRVAMKYYSPKDKPDISGIEWISLTNRSTKLQGTDGKTILQCPVTESVIHFDHVTNSFDSSNASTSHIPSEALFEFRGELLTLNSLFSRVTKVTKAEKEDEHAENPQDPAFAQSQERVERTLDIDFFPYKKNKKVSSTAIRLRYGLPGNDTVLPKLLYGKEYQFVVYNQYTNGWGLPLKKVLKSDEKDIQLSLEEVLSINMQKSPSFVFNRLENYKPVHFIAREKIVEEEKEGLENRDSLLHVVIKNGSGNSDRHILPPRIPLEHAYWHGLLFKDKMPLDQSYRWKCKYNCMLQDEKEFAAKKCDEGCSSFCGNTEMKPNYPGNSIEDDEIAYLPDPSLSGFSIQLYWDKECKIPINTVNADAKFERNAIGLTVKSYLLQLASCSARQLAFTKSDDGNSILSIGIKKGMDVYAKIYYPDAVVDKNIELWFNQLIDDARKRMPSTIGRKLPFDDPKRPPLIVHFTHAVKKPLVRPSILKQFSVAAADPEFEMVKHIGTWIGDYNRLKIAGQLTRVAQEKYEYLDDLELGKNIVCRRPSKDDPTKSVAGSSYIEFSLVSHFERLDAYESGRQVLFVPNALPTGSIELWMRKEEFIDDPDHIVLPTNAKDVILTHQPDQPVLPFSTGTELASAQLAPAADDEQQEEKEMEDAHKETNKFRLEHKIEFTNDALARYKKDLTKGTFANELSQLNNAVAKQNDPFTDTVSALEHLSYNINSSKFEIREYLIKNISKFKGYFSSKVLENVPDKNIFAYDKYARRSRAPFKVAVLNNLKPLKPEVAYAISTIQQEREFGYKTTNSRQNGNIITIYLKRGRQQSGREERVGILIKNNKNYSSQFEKQGLLSTAARDILSDRYPASTLFLTPGNIKHQFSNPEDSEYDARYDEELGMIHYLPKFSVEKQLWKIEVELVTNMKDGKGGLVDRPGLFTTDGHQLHNPFVNLSLVHYQPFSINYNIQDTRTNIANDFRISEVETATWCYLLPERNIAVYFDKPNVLFDSWGNINLKIRFDYESLHHYNNKMDNWIIRSNFILCVEGSHDGNFWYPVKSKKASTTQSEPWQLMHPLLDFKALQPGENLVTTTILFKRKSDPGASGSKKYGRFRMRLVEVEWFADKEWGATDADLMRDLNVDLQQDILDNEGMRIRYIELVY